MDEKKNKKLVIIIIILLSIITLMTGYIVYDVFSSVDSNKEFNGNVVDTPNKDDNVEQDTGKDTTIEEDNDPGLSPINTKYKDFEFVRTTKLECVSLSSLDGISDEYSGGCFKTKIENGSIVFEGEEGQKFLSAGITNFKYITVFNNFMHDVGYSNLAALTDSGNLYFPLSVSEKEKKVYFKKFDYDKKIHEMFIADETDGVYFDLLYVLNQNDELLEVEMDYEENKPSSIGAKYEEREIGLFGCGGGICYQGRVSLADKQGILDNEIIKYNNEPLKIKYMFETYFDSKWGLYIITQDNKIFTTKKKIDTSECKETCHNDEWYQIVLYKNFEVKSVSYNKDIVTITYKNGETEKIKDMYELIDLEKPYGYHYEYHNN